MAVRVERDGLGERELPAEALHGIHTARALENFPLAGRPVPGALVRAYGVVKQACLRTAAAGARSRAGPAWPRRSTRPAGSSPTARSPRTWWWTRCRAAPAPAPT